MQNTSSPPSLAKSWSSGPLIIAITLFFFYFLAFVAPQEGFLDTPPIPGDGPDYENIAFHLALGKGFAVDFSNRDWQHPYRAHNQNGRYDDLFSRGGKLSPTANRPPVLPLLIAGVYRTSGRHFRNWRYLGIFLFSLTVALSAQLALRFGGIVSAAAVVLLAAADPIAKSFSYAFMSETLAGTLLIGALALGCSTRHLAALAILLGLSVLNRTFMLPVVAILILSALLLQLAGRQILPRRSWVLFLAVFFLTIFPWGLRNCLLLKSFAPFGTQGGKNLGEAYSDAIVDEEGISSNKSRYLTRRHFQSPQTGLQREIDHSKYGVESARKWISENYSSIPYLMWIKVRAFWWRANADYQKLLSLLSLVGIVLIGNRREALVFFGVLLGATLTAALTFSNPTGRYLLPFHPLLYVLSGSAIGYLSQNVWYRLCNHQERLKL